MSSAVTLGIYEKALRSPDGDWARFFADVTEAGFSFCDLSVDETPQRAARLDWSEQTCREVRNAAADQGTLIGGICLSLHRKVMPGSADPRVRAQALDVYRKGIDLCHNLGVSVCQVAGYFAYYEAPDPDARRRYLDCLAAALPYAAQAGVMLGIENVDGHDISSIPDAVEVVEHFNNPWLQTYPDIGNIAEHGGDETTELRAGVGKMLAIHIKDTRPGEPRRVPFGTGNVKWNNAFAELARQKWSGRIMLEMWNDDSPDSVTICADARQTVSGWLQEAGISVIPAPTHNSASRTRREQQRS
ncbi:L-ribulose-5-phosphate 3-epimerase [Arcanobacterium bovis]|uniref:L-ribulose-5-phosphate 3-epimerase n=1 Tax=Arcanobacterium bovis TaxID=2529275 RepID=A0A4Q9UZI6_9ACTO|nr:L-ribulose-5-phosphate 3-epimerase [Arcanobacterium bovis]TBW21424.1 L-ribulose-5-phosphate 3-epimerase [Arcanobacterium bovis]